MRWLWQTLILSIIVLAALIFAPILLKLILKPQSCEATTTNPQKESLQNNNFYREIFGEKRCAPKRVILTVPIRQKLKTNSGQAQFSKIQEANPPEIISILTISDSPQSFYVKRIDETESGFNVKGNTCLAWKWLEQKQEETLSLSLARNLQIYDPSIKRIIFIISLPVELQKAETRLALKRSVLQEEGNSQAGEIIPIRLRKVTPNLVKVLKQKPTSSQSLKEQSWSSGAPILKDVSSEISTLTKRVGVYVDSPVKGLQDSSDSIESYEKLSQEATCEIPKSL
jgi:hypothetical protein